VTGRILSIGFARQLCASAHFQACPCDTVDLPTDKVREIKAMKTRFIPSTVEIKGQRFVGRYVKREMKSKDLYCWFHDSKPDYPHASISLSYEHENWRYFHVSFPVTKDKGGWETGTTSVSYSIHVLIDPETDQLTVERQTDTSKWKRDGKRLDFADGERAGLEFAKLFFSHAFAQMVDGSLEMAD